MHPARCLAAILAHLVASSLCAAEVRVPAHTAYFDPDPDGARISRRSGTIRWTDPALRILWFGQLAHEGELEAAVSLRLPDGAESKLRLTVGDQSREAAARGIAGAESARAGFGSFTIEKPGYVKFVLESLLPEGRSAGEIEALFLEGAAVGDAHFNLDERRNAASVHLFYPTPENAEIAWFCSEVTAVDDPVHTFYMACGFHRGYFGMQVNGPAERRIIFSVWDSGGEPVDRARVAAEDRVQLVAKGEGVIAHDFGNEGTGGHSHLKYLWKTGESQRFLLGALPLGETHTIYAGYYFHPEKKAWMLISAMKAPKDGGWLKRLHGFSENFGGSTGHLRRKALLADQWIRTSSGQWKELTEAGFSHDATGRTSRRDRFMGVERGKFFLSHGGFVDGFTKYGERFTRPATGKAPDFALPEIPRE
ncbi:MAG: DUF3472 domain-containing protein [Planctomycetes bacterium]|nr:DUF3472 domain-containing protein [Planctomycetota bacterium]